MRVIIKIAKKRPLVPDTKLESPHTWTKEEEEKLLKFLLEFPLPTDAEWLTFGLSIGASSVEVAKKAAELYQGSLNNLVFPPSFPATNLFLSLSSTDILRQTRRSSLNPPSASSNAQTSQMKDSVLASNSGNSESHHAGTERDSGIADDDSSLFDESLTKTALAAAYRSMMKNKANWDEGNDSNAGSEDSS